MATFWHFQIPMTFTRLIMDFFSSEEYDIGQLHSVSHWPLAFSACFLCGALRPCVRILIMQWEFWLMVGSTLLTGFLRVIQDLGMCF